MGDSGEGLVDAEGRIQERMEELELERRTKGGRVIRNPEMQRALESLKMARAGIEQQLNMTSHSMRKEQLGEALKELDRQIAALKERMAP
jgi:hypothetical protein